MVQLDLYGANSKNFLKKYGNRAKALYFTFLFIIYIIYFYIINGNICFLLATLLSSSFPNGNFVFPNGNFYYNDGRRCKSPPFYHLRNSISSPNQFFCGSGAVCFFIGGLYPRNSLFTAVSYSIGLYPASPSPR